MKMYRRLLALLLFFLALASTLMRGATPAYAHAIVVRTDPPDGAVLGGPPRQVRLWFSEPIALGFASFDLVDSAGKHIAITAHSDAASVALAVRGQGGSAAEVVLDLPALPPSVYRLSWTALSNTDLHNTVGAIVFGVQRATDGATSAAAEPAPAPAELALRWLNFGALAGMIGALALALLVLPQATSDSREIEGQADRQARRQAGGQDISIHMRARLLRLASCLAVLAMLAGLGLLFAQAAAGATSGQNMLASAWSLVGGTGPSVAWLLRPLLLLLLAAMLASSARNNAADRSAPAVIMLVLAICTAQALQGHATAFAELSPLRVAADALHLLAAGIWAGGLLALVLAIVPLLRAGPEQHQLAWAILRRFGALAAASLAGLLVTGLFMSGQQVASLDALLTTLYGRALLLKIGLVGAVALLGLRNAAALHSRVAAVLGRALTPALPRQLSRAAAGEGEDTLPSPAATGAELGVRASTRLARRLRLEAIGAALVLLLAAALTAAQPARGPAFDPPLAETQAAALAHANDLVVTLALKPNRPGQNFVTLSVLDTRRPAPAPIDEVAVRFGMPGQTPPESRPAAGLGKGRYELADASIASAGELGISVTVRRAGLPDAVATFPWTVLPAAQQPRAVLISDQPLAPWADRAALAIVLLLAGLLIGSGARLRVAFIKSIKSGVAARRLRPLRKD